MPESFEYRQQRRPQVSFCAHQGRRARSATSPCDGHHQPALDAGRGRRRSARHRYPDLFFANDYGVSELYANQGGTRFVDVAEATGVGRTPKSGMNASFGDIFNDGRLAIYKANISEPGVLVQGNDLWVPKSAGAGEYDNLAPSLGVDLGGWSWGAQFGDLNNDGHARLYLVNGYVSAGSAAATGTTSR
jgi:hypothetical protein